MSVIPCCMSKAATGVCHGGHHGEDEDGLQERMLLRDYFAGQALAGLLATKAELSAQDETILAEVAYSYADDMLKAREK